MSAHRHFKRQGRTARRCRSGLLIRLAIVCKSVSEPIGAKCRRFSRIARSRTAPGLSSVSVESSLLFALARPRDARAVELRASALRLTMRFGPREITLQHIHAVTREPQGAWYGVRIRTAGDDTVVSCLRRREAFKLVAAVEEARIAWWRDFLAVHADALRNIDGRLADLETPRCYVRRGVFSSLVEEVQRTAPALPQSWPEPLDAEPVVQSAKRIRSFLSDPKAARERANEAFLVGELERSRSYLDRVETRPLTEEQRRAVCGRRPQSGGGKPPAAASRRSWWRRPAGLSNAAVGGRRIYCCSPSHATPTTNLRSASKNVSAGGWPGQ